MTTIQDVMEKQAKYEYAKSNQALDEYVNVLEDYLLDNDAIEESVYSNIVDLYTNNSNNENVNELYSMFLIMGLIGNAEIQADEAFEICGKLNHIHRQFPESELIASDYSEILAICTSITVEHLEYLSENFSDVDRINTNHLNTINGIAEYATTLRLESKAC